MTYDVRWVEKPSLAPGSISIIGISRADCNGGGGHRKVTQCVGTATGQGVSPEGQLGQGTPSPSKPHHNPLTYKHRRRHGASHKKLYKKFLFFFFFIVLHVDHKPLNMKETHWTRMRNLNVLVLFIQKNRSSPYLLVFVNRPVMTSPTWRRHWHIAAIRLWEDGNAAVGDRGVQPTLDR